MLEDFEQFFMDIVLYLNKKFKYQSYDFWLYLLFIFNILLVLIVLWNFFSCVAALIRITLPFFEK